MIYLRCLVLWTCLTQPLSAHEFWISPEAYVIAKGDQMQADLRVGEELSGAGYSYNPQRFARFDILLGDLEFPVEGRIGDVPALDMAVFEDGLAIIVHETTDSRLTYTKWEKFEKFARHKDFTEVLEQHRSRGLPEDRFIESYRRFAKSLVAVGTGRGADRETGLRTEIVALENPYRIARDRLPVRVLFEGRPRVDAQVELFEMATDGTVRVSLHRTDDEGIAQVPIRAGHEYLVDAVVMLPLETADPAEEPSWYSLWAALTFKIPEAPLP